MLNPHLVATLCSDPLVGKIITISAAQFIETSSYNVVAFGATPQVLFPNFKLWFLPRVNSKICRAHRAIQSTQLVCGFAPQPLEAAGASIAIRTAPQCHSPQLSGFQVWSLKFVSPKKIAVVCGATHPKHTQILCLKKLSPGKSFFF